MGGRGVRMPDRLKEATMDKQVALSTNGRRQVASILSRFE
jgi:hypothetical protein